MEPTKPAAKIAVQNSDGDAADIPLHVTEKILCSISPLESARFLTVCKSWASTIFSRLAKPIPHLFALEASAPRAGEQPRRRGSIFSLPIDGSKELNPVMPAKLPVMPSHAYASHMRLSSALPSGCVSFDFPISTLLMAAGRPSNHVALANPVTGAAQSVEVYRAASLFGFQPKVRAATGAEAFFVSELRSDGEMSIFLVWRAEEWGPRIKLPMAMPSVPQQFSYCTNDIDLAAYADGVFYAMELLGFTFTVDTRAPPPMRIARLNARSILEKYTSIFGTGFLRSCHMLASEGEVLFVGPVLDTPIKPCKFVDKDAAIGGFTVFRLDVEGARWVKVERLAGDRSLFVSEQSSYSVCASETPGCRSNCIYFVTDLGGNHSNGSCNWGVYSMEEEKVLFQSSVGSPGIHLRPR
ncbi:LOW QUALITY PROTEIN: hypothetical protein BRADI_1g48970v3 [Brachypodium distachyon]|uniref:KIB1-4 beta-propeller domain-containing protein n=1 Tax=Brachypodium distachyon TaxID=15368 RepID=A0A2K2DQF1_BRADI|nr:LOW QUALITY PROTEIN: hypothetical protein BRADI_1g48970v3 [Brachypodium distachyon]